MLQAYDYCGLQMLTVSTGAKFTSLASFTSAVINISWEIAVMYLDAAWQARIIDAINKANYTGSKEDWR